MIPLNISAAGAFLAGVISFFSPCILPLVPSYMSYITGSVFSGLENEEDLAGIKRNTTLYSLLFIAGFSSVFVLLGCAASFAGSLFLEYRDYIRITGGVLIFVFGLHIMGWLRIGVLNSYFKLDAKKTAPGYLRSFLAGIIFAAGWTPCVGPILGSILILAGTEATILNGILLLGLYSLGMAIPFFVISLSANFFLARLNKLKEWVPLINNISGIALIITGIFLITGMFGTLSSLFY
ncbi:MAG: cytochrome c biogenesis protein CcdA [Candidatus Margulisiibacteriota bacterium]